MEVKGFWSYSEIFPDNFVVVDYQEIKLEDGSIIELNSEANNHPACKLIGSFGEVPHELAASLGFKIVEM